MDGLNLSNSRNVILYKTIQQLDANKMNYK